MRRVNSRRQQAIDHLSSAELSIGKAISLLGGYTRATQPRRNISTFVARKMIESLRLRLHAAVNLLLYGERPSPTTLRNEFEEEYDKQRRPGC